ncbi:MAG TPA: twin-arginine translocation signal domain-containing protein, partial [Thermomicrobiales bacterium]|nr:twin-arginine translocation signal domain-containing protein [Thermomicrobiales bacterium]
MDGKRFDELATGLSHSNSRRRVLRTVAAGGLASGLAAVGFRQNEADAKKRRRRKRCKVSQNTVLTVPLIPGGGNGALGDVCSAINLCGTGLACDNGKCKKCVA